MNCRWCKSENVLDREICPHCGEDTRRLEEAFAAQIPPDEPAAAGEDGGDGATMPVVKSLAVSAVVILMLVFGAESSYSNWPEWVWPRSVQSSAETVDPFTGTGGSPAPSAAPASCENRGPSVTDGYGRSYDRWYCTVERPGALYLTPDPSSETAGHLNERESWFACQVQGVSEPEGGGTTWLYTQGDDYYSGDGWGYFPAGWVSPTWNSGPVPDLPSCE